MDISRFVFDEKKRTEMRQELGINNEYVIGHVGRFNLQKNHEYLLRIFKEVRVRVPDAKLLLLGDGELFSSIKKLAEEFEIADSVIFAGVHKDVEDYYQARVYKVFLLNVIYHSKKLQEMYICIFFIIKILMKTNL